MDKEILDMINEAIVYSSILSGLEFIKDECNGHSACKGCKFLDEKDCCCMFKSLPSYWNLHTIEKALKGE